MIGQSAPSQSLKMIQNCEEGSVDQMAIPPSRGTLEGWRSKPYKEGKL